MDAQTFYRPAPRGLEISIGERLAELRRLNDEARGAASE
jgi:putative ATPase